MTYPIRDYVKIERNAARDVAMRAARCLVRSLGPGWKPVVWPNYSNWFWKVTFGDIVEITPPMALQRPELRLGAGSGTYSVSIDSSWHKDARSPRVALKTAVALYEKDMKHRQRQLRIVQKALKSLGRKK